MSTQKATTIILIGLTAFVTGVIGIKYLVKPTPAVALESAESTTPSKTEQRILRAQRAIEQRPGTADAYNQLASAYMQKARETNDFAFNGKADEAINRSLSIQRDNYDALKLRAKLQLTYHRFAEALETARRAQSVREDDNDVWGLITDALVELGDYPRAIESAQRMVDLRPASSSYARISYLRSLHGDTVGAIQAMKSALRAADPNDREAIAWCHAQLGNELLNAGNLEAADAEFDEALRTFADHQLALHGKARAQIARDDLQAAVEIYRLEQSKRHSADTSQALGDLYKALGHENIARTEYEKFEILELENAALEQSWRHMVNYWLDHDKNLEEALARANDEYRSRKDIFTCDSVAWAMFKNGRVQQAHKLIKEALRTGSKDARINYHAGVIYRAMKMRKEAAHHLRLGAALNASFDPLQSKTAQRMLAEL